MDRLPPQRNDGTAPSRPPEAGAGRRRETRRTPLRHRWRGHYAASVAIAITALSPFIMVSTAAAMFAGDLRADLQMSRFAVQLIAGLAIAGYAFGALTAGDLVQRFRQRYLFFLCEGLFVLGSVATAMAPDVAVYGIGRIASGFATGLLLVIAVPPVIQHFPPERLRTTFIWINIGFFGATCIGPLLGGAVAALHAWRLLFAGLGAVALGNLLAAYLVLPVTDPPNPKLRLDPFAGVLGITSVVLPFFATAELTRHGFAAMPFVLPLAAGLACFVALILSQHHQREPLSPVDRMWTTISVTGVMVAMIGGSVFVALLDLAQQLQLSVVHRTPLATGILFTPQVGGVLVTAVLLGRLLQTRYLPLLILFGMACLGGAGLMLLATGADGATLPTLFTALLLGLGAGATVAPGMLLAGMPVASRILGRVFALVELVRSLADFVMAPVVMKLADVSSTTAPLDWHGIATGTRVTLWIAACFVVVGIGLWLAGGAGLPRPDIRGWIAEGGTGLDSPRLFARLRG